MTSQHQESHHNDVIYVRIFVPYDEDLRKMMPKGCATMKNDDDLMATPLPYVLSRNEFLRHRRHLKILPERLVQLVPRMRS